MFAISTITFTMPSIGATLLPEIYNGTTYADYGPFTGVKGEIGATGPQGATGAAGADSTAVADMANDDEPPRSRVVLSAGCRRRPCATCVKSKDESAARLENMASTRKFLEGGGGTPADDTHLVHESQS